MEIDPHLRSFQRLISAFNQRDTAALLEEVSEGFVGHGPDADVRVVGREGMCRWVEHHSTMYSDGVWKLISAVSVGRRVAAELILAGTNDGAAVEPPFGRIEPTGRLVRVPWSMFLGFDDDNRVSAARFYRDTWAMLQQLGIAGATTATTAIQEVQS